MSVWETIETAIVDALSALAPGGSSLLATVKGQTARDRRPLVTAIGRERLPAAYVVIAGRDASDRVTRRAGPVSVSVLLATGSQRNEAEVRTGSGEAAGLYELSAEAAGALQDLAIGSDRCLLLVDERPAGGEEGMIVWEQRYEVRRRSETSAPTFGGTALAGSGSEVRVELGPARRATSVFSFPGIDGVFERGLGLRDRTIHWRGQLRATDDSALNTIESQIEDEVATGEAKTMVDAWGRSHASCVVRSFERKGPRGRDALSGQALQDFEITFGQLNG